MSRMAGTKRAPGGDEPSQGLDFVLAGQEDQHVARRLLRMHLYIVRDY